MGGVGPAPGPNVSGDGELDPDDIGGAPAGILNSLITLQDQKGLNASSRVARPARLATLNGPGAIAVPLVSAFLFRD